MIELAPQNPYGLSLATPLVAATGCLGYGSEVARALGLATPEASHGLGAIVTRTTTLAPRRARPLPAMVETPAGLVYHGSEHNPGLRGALGRHGTAWAAWNTPVIVSIGGATAQEVAEVAGNLEGIEGIAGIEVPLSYCNALNLAEAKKLVTAVRAATFLPLVIKLPCYGPELPALAQVAVEGGADLLALNGGLPATSPAGDGTLFQGLLCGPTLRPLALASLALVRATVAVPIIAGGGVSSAADARDLLTAGATAVALGSLLLHNPWAAAQIAAELKHSSS